MSISPPSDIVLDVARAADPTRLQEAAARLKRLKPISADPFDTLLAAAPASPQANVATPTSNLGPSSETVFRHAPAGAKGPISPPAKAYQGFEAMALSTFIESAMPADGSAVFGSGTAGNVWKSMLAEQIAAQMARAGGIGIADELGRSAARAAARPQAEAPAPAAVNGTPTLPPMHLTTAMERGFLRAVMPGLPATDKTSSS